MILQSATVAPAVQRTNHGKTSRPSEVGSNHGPTSAVTTDRSDFNWKKIAKHAAVGAGAGAATSASGLLGKTGVVIAAATSGTAGAVYGFSAAASEVLPKNSGILETLFLGPLALMVGTGGAIVGAGGGGVIGALSALVGSQAGPVGIAAATLVGGAVGGTSEYLHQKREHTATSGR